MQRRVQARVGVDARDPRLSVVVDADSVTEFTGETRTFARNGDSGKEVRYEFCPTCGTTVRWHVDLIPNRQIFAAGTFDDMGALAIVGEMYADAAMPWARLGCDLVRAGPPDDHFRTELIARTKLLCDRP